MTRSRPTATNQRRQAAALLLSTAVLLPASPVEGFQQILPHQQQRTWQHTPDAPTTTTKTRTTTTSMSRPYATSALHCQLLGMNSGDPTQFELMWPTFCERGGGTDVHGDGFGLAYYQGESLRQFHDVEAACTSPLAQFLGQQPIETRNMLAHIRYATAGAVDLANVHPFSREMWGINFCFVHNGQVPLFEDYPDTCLGEDKEEHERIYNPVGSTDSEATFCAILNALRAKFTDTMPSLPVLYEELKSLCDEIVRYNKEETILNFLLTCGPHLLWVYSWPGKRPGSKVWNGLYYTIRDDNQDTSLLDESDRDNYGVNFHGVKQHSSPASSGQVAVVATKPLTKDEEWIELERGELLVLDEGRPRVSVIDLFRVELQGHGLAGNVLQPPRLEEDMRRYQFEPTFFAGGGI